MDHEIEVAEAFANLSRNQQDIADCIKTSVNNGRINVLFQVENSILRIYPGFNKRSHFIADVSTQDQIGIGALANTDNPNELIVEGKTIDLKSIKKALPAFIHDNYPDADNLPIDIYTSQDDFETKKPASTVKPMPELASIDP